MSNRAGRSTIPVDLSNPGQFFACCGLFELADRKWRLASVVAYFEPGLFVLEADDPGCPIAAVLNEFAGVRCAQLDPQDNGSSPLELGLPFALRLDWWCRPKKGSIEVGGSEELKTWAGKQMGPVIFQLTKDSSARAAQAKSPLDYSAAIYDNNGAERKDKTISPFYFDCRREGTSLDLGFSPDKQDMSVIVYPAVESLALVGLQRFRPFLDRTAHPRSFVYRAWSKPIPISTAAVSVSGAVGVHSCGCFRFTTPSRGGEYLKMFSRAKRERSTNV